MNLLAIVGVWFVVFGSSSAFYSPSDDVIKLTGANFETAVLDSEKVWVVQFYATWCRYSQDLAPEYRRVATALKGVINVGAVNCEEGQAERKLCEQIVYIDHYPTVLIFGADKYSPLEYDGDNTAKDIFWVALHEMEKSLPAKTYTDAERN
ncbi:disulfide-isomerase A6 [Anopheles sinensis]|uniref:Disulfide-isomerase A6 n=1 Tax=Anopheles sinensis TaxID=74873 RepID=A0A084VS01_ANOSI|nr:disulfide-isomerase A6 [Anopheles sinensis]